MKKILKLEGLDCANCAAKMEDGIKKIAGVEEATVSFMTQKVTLLANDENMESIIEQAIKVIKKVEPDIIIK
ncbi:heavy-metal-associated domain-containing protein [Clostridium sp. Marseille-P299]|uniref:heavy-metal-associated domain-containing protein n=1 Tax=Clostridium sp. Marseille-P299 TaxID=1805477 RepID=UPI0008354E68|nr:heavy metal-associated domain-containing protein [Clostridium sp. Marseille-P299]